MNNDTPQVSGADTHGYPQDPGSFGDQDGEDFPAFRGWTGWGDRVEPAGPDDGDPQPFFSGYELPSYESQAYEPRSYEPQTYESQLYGSQSYEAPDMRYTRDMSYVPAVGYAPDDAYAPDDGYRRELGFAEDPGYGGDLGYRGGLEAGPEATSVPPMEQLADPDEFFDTPVLASRSASVPAPALASDPEAAAPAAPVFMVSAPVAALPQESTQSWNAVQSWEESSAWHEGEPPAPPPLTPETEYTRETSDSLTSESLLHGKRVAPGSGWRRSVYRATGGLLRFGESAAEMRRRDLINRVRTPVAGGHHRVAVLSLKGGVGKTTTAVGLGATFATLRGDRVIAVDANPDRGTLSDKVRLETAATIRDLLDERGQVSRYADVRAFTSQAPSRLEVLASDRDPAVSVAFGAEDYSDVAQMLEHFYSICITDCGTGLLHSAMAGVLALADQIILVSSPSVDGARSASATLDWLEAHGCADLVRSGVVVLSAIRPKSKSTVDIDRLEHHFAARCRAVARIPYDPHLEEGAEIELELLGSDTAEAYLSLAAVVGDGLAWSRRMTSCPALP
jgi:MinD-like ATPase involved in chromosome partitioning or flagellar assembly